MWSTGESTSSITVTAAGTYFVTQTVGGCTSAQGSGTAAPKATPATPVITVVNNCGSVTLSIPAGGTILWSDGESTPSITVTTPGAYSFSVTRTVDGCTSSPGSASGTVNTSPTTFTVTGGGSYCSGTGLTITLSGSESGVNYQLKIGSTNTGSPVAGTGSALNFTNQTALGTYTIVATNTTSSCTSTMTGSAVITAGTLPTVFNVTGGGQYCSGGAGLPVGLSGSQSGVNYQLKRGSTVVTTVAGTGSSIAFGNQTTAGTYTVIATNASSGCTSTMSSSAIITVNALPTTFNVTGGGGYCSGTGLTITLSGSQSGVNYQLKIGSTNTGSPVAGTGSALNFTNKTALGTYTIVAINTTSSCTSTMTGSAVITAGTLPTVFSVTGGGQYCSGGAGLPVGLAGSQSGVNYQLKRGSTVVATVGGSGSSIAFGNQTTAGTYTVVATNASSGCTSNMSSSAIITVNALPTTFTVTGGGSYCSGTGLTITLSGSQSGVNYQLKIGSTNTGSPVAGTGSALNFTNQTAPGTYTIVATNTTTSCTSTMTGSAVITAGTLPTVFSVTGGGQYCSGGAGLPVGLSGSQSGVNYQLKRGSTVVTTVAGTGSSIAFGNQTTAGTYTVVATNASSGCTNNMSSSAIITVNALPTTFTVTGGGSSCSGSAVAIGLSGSQSGVNYQLKRGTTVVQTVAGTGSSLSFTSQTTAGTYTVVATNATTSCTSTMTGSAVITAGTLPTVFSVTGGGQYCSGGAGLPVGLSGSQSGVNYQLKRGSTVVTTVAGSGSSIAFGNQTTAGTYTVVATNASSGCTNNMSSSAIITVNALPTTFTVTGGGSSCSGSAVAIGLSGSQSGVNYQLKRGTTVVQTVAGTGSSLSFTSQTTAGTYTVVATNATTSCTSTMTGSAVITAGTLPTVFSVTGGGQYCSGGAGLPVGLSGSQSGVNYQLKRGSTVVTTVAGSGSSIAFGNQTTAGTYTVVATNASSGCTNNMSSSAIITVNALPTTFNVTGGGSSCSGSAVAIGLSGSQSGVNYQLKRGTTVVQTVAGTGSPLSFTSQTTAGTYTVVATNATTSCTSTMTGSATIVTGTLPALFTVTGGGVSCNGSGAPVGLSGSASGVNYQLKNGSANVGTPKAGTGAAISFGNQTAAGTYTVVATNTSGCSRSMTGSVTITLGSSPTASITYNASAFCKTGAVAVTRTGQSGGTYSSASGLSINSSTGAVNLATSTPGTYTVTYTFSNGTCSNTATTSFTINALPSASISYGVNELCNTGTKTVTRTGQSGGIYSSTSGLNINSSTGTINLAASTPSSTPYIVTYTFSDNHCSNTTTTSVKVVTCVSRPANPVQSLVETIAPISGNFTVRVMPNPTSNYFTLQLNSQSYEKFKITVTDVIGRIVEQKPDVPANSTLQLGNKYHPGVYIAEILQGKNKVVLRLIKEGN